MTTNLLNILIALGDTVVPVVIDRLNRKKDLAGRVEVTSKMYINNKKSIDALVMMIVDEVDALSNIPKNPTDEDIVSVLRGIGDLERSLPLYPIDKNALASYTCGTGPIKYDVRDIVDETMQETIMTLIKVAIKYSSLPCGLRSLTDDIIWKRMFALVSLLAELLEQTYSRTRDKDLEPPWMLDGNAFVARGTRLYLPGNFTVTLLDARKYTTEAEEAAMREEENKRLEEEARSRELMELEPQLPEIFFQNEVLNKLHSKFDSEELIKMIKSFLAFFCHASMNATFLRSKLSTPEVKLVDLFYTATTDEVIGYDTVTYADVGRAFKLFDQVLRDKAPISKLAVYDADSGDELLVYHHDSELDDDLYYTSESENKVPDNWMLTIKVK